MEDIETVQTSRFYFDYVLAKNHENFFSAPSTLVNVFNLATSLFHFHEWLFVEFENKLKVRFGADLTRGNFWGKAEAANRKFGYIRDVANASKHVVLTRKTSTGMSHIANTEIQISGYVKKGYVEKGYVEEVRKAVLHDKWETISFDDCANELFDYWRILLEELEN